MHFIIRLFFKQAAREEPAETSAPQVPLRSPEKDPQIARTEVRYRATANNVQQAEISTNWVLLPPSRNNTLLAERPVVERPVATVLPGKMVSLTVSKRKQGFVVVTVC